MALFLWQNKEEILKATERCREILEAADTRRLTTEERQNLRINLRIIDTWALTIPDSVTAWDRIKEVLFPL